jgi:hypothetical protein
MKIQYVSKYLSLSKEGLVPELLCPMDQGSLYSNQDLQDNIFLYCISCSYKKTIGIVDYENIVDLVERAING